MVLIGYSLSPYLCTTLFRNGTCALCDPFTVHEREQLCRWNLIEWRQIVRYVQMLWRVLTRPPRGWKLIETYPNQFLVRSFHGDIPVDQCIGRKKSPRFCNFYFSLTDPFDLTNTNTMKPFNGSPVKTSGSEPVWDSMAFTEILSSPINYCQFKCNFVEGVKRKVAFGLCYYNGVKADKVSTVALINKMQHVPLLCRAKQLVNNGSPTKVSHFCFSPLLLHCTGCQQQQT